MLKRFTIDFTVISNLKIDEEYLLLTLQHPDRLPDIAPGQFVEIKIPDTAHTFLRRPISIHNVDYHNNQMQLLIRIVGNGSLLLSYLKSGDILNLVFPLGNGFMLPSGCKHPLLIGGGCGVAPMLYFGKVLKDQGLDVNYLFGAKEKSGLLRIEEYEKVGNVNIATEDGSVGAKGFVTQHPVLSDKTDFDAYFVCGPTPMMKAVATIAKDKNVPCFVSLENKMACGIGVCLCCVTETNSGHKCVCSDGPVFNVNDLKW